jgi:hypothetical protein
MALAVLRLLAVPGEAQAMAAAGREWVKRQCNPKKHAQAIEAVYESLMGGQR